MENENNLEHYTVLADGIVGELSEGFVCEQGRAVMGIKVWAHSIDEAGEMAESIGQQIGFTIQGNVEIYKTEPIEPAGDSPHGYDINFTPYDDE